MNESDKDCGQKDIFICELVHQTAQILNKDKKWKHNLESIIVKHNLSVGKIYLMKPEKLIKLGIATIDVVKTMQNIIQKNIDNAIVYEEGNIPIILTIPHGGKRNQFISKRTINNTRCAGIFNSLADSKTNHLSQRIIEAIQKNNKNYKPFRIKANLFHRSQIDANRNIACAVPHDSLLSNIIYKKYHSFIEKSIKLLKKRGFREILLLDIHGHNITNRKKWLYIGTNKYLTLDNGKINKIKNNLFEPIVNESKKNKCYTHILQNHKYQKDDPHHLASIKLDGGYTIQLYGQKTGVNAIQLEFGVNLRMDHECRNVIGQVIGKIISQYLNKDKDKK